MFVSFIKQTVVKYYEHTSDDWYLPVERDWYSLFVGLAEHHSFTVASH